ncbi:MAG: redoxin domain-containing protein, partial [Pseudomonadota bacterium]
VDLAAPGWRAVFVIRGAHCSICRIYLQALEARLASFTAMGVDVVVASADPMDVAHSFAEAAGFSGTVGGALTPDYMRNLGLWMTGPDVSPLDYVHAEPGFFLIDPDGRIAAMEVSSLPALRPDLDWLEKGLAYLTNAATLPVFGDFEVAP